MAMISKVYISSVSKMGSRLIVNIPSNFRDEFEIGDLVEIVKVKTTIGRIE